MEQHYHLSDSEFEIQFEQCMLPPELFSHEAHLRLAWIHVSRYGKQEAMENICSQLKAFTDFHGAAGKYNKTLTVAAVKTVYHFMRKSTTNSFVDFIAEFPRLKDNFREVLSFHYSIDIFTNETAKKEYLQPDLLPFD